MNKRDLIKALFKDPTIKALYESGHFNATDINRAILTEASELEEAKPREAGSKGVATSSWAKFLKDNSLRQQYDKVIEFANERSRKYTAATSWEDLKRDFGHTPPENASPESFEEWKDNHLGDIKKYFITVVKNAQAKLDTAAAAATPTDPKKEEAKEILKQTNAAVGNLPNEVQTGMIDGLDSEGGEGDEGGQETPNNVNEFASYFDTSIPKEAADEFMNAIFEEGDQSDLVKLTKAFVIHYFIEKDVLNEEMAQLPDWNNSFESFKKEMELGEKASSSLFEILNDQKFHDAAAKVRDLIKKPDAEPQGEQGIEQKRQQLANRASAALSVLNVEDNELLKNDVFMIFMGSVLEKEGVIQEVEEQLESYVDKYLPQLQNEESRKEFYITADEAVELKTFLETNKSDVDKIIAAAIKNTKENEDSNIEDVSPPDLAEFQEKWTEELQTFFGKNPKKSSFMRRLLLSSQAEMLYKVLAILEEIADPSKMAALTDMNQDDEKENQAERKAEPQLQELFKKASLKIPNKPKSREDVLPDTSYQDREQQLKAAQEISMDVAGQDYHPDEQSQEEPSSQPGKIELPEENKRIIKQDLQSMVDLLRQLKKAISSYSKYSTQKSVDPRFDGSKLKANMDDLLTQVQDDVYDLYSNLKPPAPKAKPKPQGDEEDSNLEEALNGIMLEEADPERQEKIKFVREVYDNAKKEYIYSLATSMEKGKWSKSQQSANDILKILKDDKFISMFPTGMKTSSGRVMTVGDAYESMKEVIQDFIETVRDIVLISKTKYISKTSLTQARNNLLQISLRIADLFRVASKFPAKEIKKAKEAEAADPANQALTGVPTENLEQGSEDNAMPAEDQITTDTSDEEGGEQEEDPPIQPFFNRIFTENGTVSPNKEIIEKIEATFSDEEDRLKAKQIFSYFLLYFLPEKINEADDSDDDDDFFGVNWDDPVFAFYSKLSKNSKTPESLKVFLKGNRLNLIDTDGILRFKTPEEILGAAGNKLALFRTLEQNPAMKAFIASLKGESSDDETLDKSGPATDNDSDTLQESLEKSLRPIIEKMLNEHYNH